MEKANAFVKETNAIKKEQLWHSFEYAERQIKKNNFEIHLKSQNHRDAILRLKEQQIWNQGETTCEQTETVEKESSNSGAPHETLLKPMIQTLTSRQRT